MLAPKPIVLPPDKPGITMPGFFVRFTACITRHTHIYSVFNMAVTNPKRMGRLLFTLPDDLKVLLHKHKAKTGVSISETIRRALEMYLKRK